MWMRYTSRRRLVEDFKVSHQYYLCCLFNVWCGNQRLKSTQTQLVKSIFSIYYANSLCSKTTSSVDSGTHLSPEDLCLVLPQGVCSLRLRGTAANPNNGTRSRPGIWTKATATCSPSHLYPHRLSSISQSICPTSFCRRRKIVFASRKIKVNAGLIRFHVNM